MSIWVIRGGKFGEYENRFLNEDKVYLTRDGFKTDLNKIQATIIGGNKAWRNAYCGYGKGNSIKEIIKTLQKHKQIDFKYSFSPKRIF